MATQPIQETAPEHKKVHVSKSNGNPNVPPSEETIELYEAAGDTVTWEKANSQTPGFEVVFDFPEKSPFASDRFRDGDTNDEIVVKPDKTKRYRYRIGFTNGGSLDPGIIIR